MSNESADAEVVEQVAVTFDFVPATSSSCFESAARVLRFAEVEDHPARFEQYMSLAERWMELGSVLGGE